MPLTGWVGWARRWCGDEYLGKAQAAAHCLVGHQSSVTALKMPISNKYTNTNKQIYKYNSKYKHEYTSKIKIHHKNSDNIKYNIYGESCVNCDCQEMTNQTPSQANHPSDNVVNYFCKIIFNAVCFFCSVIFVRQTNQVIMQLNKNLADKPTKCCILSLFTAINQPNNNAVK